jgi:hypothetical protein
MRDGVFFLRIFTVVTTAWRDPSRRVLPLGNAIVMDGKVDWASMFTQLGRGGWSF